MDPVDRDGIAVGCSMHATCTVYEAQCGVQFLYLYEGLDANFSSSTPCAKVEIGHREDPSHHLPCDLKGKECLPGKKKRVRIPPSCAVRTLRWMQSGARSS